MRAVANADTVLEKAEASRLPVTWKQALCVLACLAAVLLAVEWRYPYYFLQDDNRDFLLPRLVHSWEALRSGEIALYNFHQYSGFPQLASGQTGALYPPAFLSLFLSRSLFGHFFAAVDVLTILHLALGALGWLFFFRRIGMGPPAAIWGGLACALNSFLIYGGASWGNISATGAWFPWMLYFGLGFLRRPGIADWLGLLAARLLLFYFGFVQYFLYASALEMLVLAAVWCARRERTPAGDRSPGIPAYLAAWIVTALLTAPLLLPMWRQMQASEHRRAAIPLAEFVAYSVSPLAWIGGLLNPFSGDVPKNLGEQLPFLGHVGYLTFFLVLCAMGWAVQGRFTPERQRLTSLFLALGILTLTLSMGFFVLYLHEVPIYNRFRWPFKFLLFANFFEVMVAALALDHFLNHVVDRPFQKRGLILVLALTLTNAGILYAGGMPRPARMQWDAVPLAEPLRDKLAGGKIFTLGFPWGVRRTAPSLGFDYATLWGLYHFAGYDPLVPEANSSLAMRLDYNASFDRGPEFLPWDTLRQWGVRWYVVSNETSKYDAALLQRGLTVIHRDADRTVYRDAQAQPLVFWLDGRSAPVDYRIQTNSIELRTQSAEAGRLGLNFLWDPRFDARIDGRPGPLDSTRDGQMLLDVPAGAHAISVRFHEPALYLGLWIALAGAAAAVYGAIRLRS